jgi:hypothetical protein
MEQSLSWKLNRSSPSQGFLPNFILPNFYHSIHKSLPPVPSSSQTDVPIATSHFLKIHFNIITPFILSTPRGLFHSGFPTKILYGPLLCATCRIQLIVLHLIIRIIFVASTDHKAPRCVSFSTPLLPCPSLSH